MRYQTLQYLRGILASLVVAYHCSFTIFEDSRFWGVKPFHGIFDFCHASVFTFFVLSGFILFTVHRKEFGHPERLKNYAVRRFLRVYPTYWAVVIPVAAVYLLNPGLSKPILSSRPVIANSFLLIGPNSHACLAVAWTLFHEIAFYAVFALSFLNRKLGIAALALWWTACGVTALFPAAMPSHYLLEPVNLLFAAGLTCYLVTDKWKLPRGWAIALLGTLIFLGEGVYETQILHASPAHGLLLYGLGSALVICGLVWQENFRPAAPRPLLRELGDASYSIYLVHYAMLSVFGRLFLRVFGRVGAEVPVLFVLLTAVAIAAGVVFHRVVERPLLQALVGAWRNRERRAAALHGAPAVEETRAAA